MSANPQSLAFDVVPSGASGRQQPAESSSATPCNNIEIRRRYDATFTPVLVGEGCYLCGRSADGFRLLHSQTLQNGKNSTAELGRFSSPNSSIIKFDTMKRLFICKIAAIACIVGFVGCVNNENVPPTPSGNGEPTSMHLAVKMPKTPAGYATTDPNATIDEVEMHSLAILIYEETGTGFYLQQKETKTIADFTPNSSNDTYVLNESSKIATTTGAKKVFVAMNYAGALPEEGTAIGKIADLIIEISRIDNLTSQGLTMFTTEMIETMLLPEDDADYNASNKLSATVKRAVAKISVQEGADLRDPSGRIKSQGGWLSTPQFAIGNINKTLFMMQNVVGTAPNRVVHDTNWATYNTTDFLKIADYSETSAMYKIVSPSNANVNNVSTAYATENTVERYNVNGDNLTYVSVRAKYVPKSFCNETGESKGDNNPDMEPVSFWTVIMPNGDLYYFDVAHEASRFAGNNEGTKLSDEYKNGLCYWRGYLNAGGVPDPSISGSIAAKFDVLRNVYYKAVVNKMKAPGYPSDEGIVTEPTSLLLDVAVQAWSLVSDDWEL